MDDRDRAAPVALPRDQPVAQAKADGRSGAAACVQRLDDPALSLGRGEAGELARVDERLVLGVRRERAHLGRLTARRDDHRRHRQPVLHRELVVALVVGGHGHDRSGPVLHQHVIGDPDRDLLLVDRVGRIAAREDAVLLLLLALGGRAPRRAAHVVEDGGLLLRSRDEPRDQRVLGREDEEGRAEERVRPGREDGYVHVQVVDPEEDIGALGAADPVALDGQDALGPLHLPHLVQQMVGVGRDLEEPLREVARLDLAAAALAAAVHDLLVREHGLVVRAPDDGRLLAEGEVGLVQLQEQPLRPAVVLGLVCRDLARPVDRPAEPLHLLADCGDVALGDLAWVAALTDGRVLGREAERVEAHRAHHVAAPAAVEMGQDVDHRVVEDVAHVQRPRRVRQHLEQVELVRVGAGALGRTGHAEGLLVLPDALPLHLDLRRFVSLHARLRVQKSLSSERPSGSRRGVNRVASRSMREGAASA